MFNGEFLATCSNEGFLVCVLVVLLPSAVLDFEHQRWMSAIENQMPSLVRGVSEAQETGLTIVKAFEKVVQNKMVAQPLADEVHRLTVQMSWGPRFKVLLLIQSRIGFAPIVNRFCSLVFGGQ
jgi:pilus assembly protein TadC